MKKDIDKKKHFMYFLEKWLIIGVILFFVIQLTAIVFVNMITPQDQRITDEEREEYNKDYIGHWYNGTFFIEMTVSENFKSQEEYQKMEQESNNDRAHNACKYIGIVFAVVFAVSIIISAYKERKKKLLDGNGPIFVIISGIAFLLFKITEEIDLFIDTIYYKKYSVGFLSTVRYYPQIHYIFIIPALIILMGLVFRYKQKKNNANTIKVICALIAVVGFSFILYRFGIRVYELICNKTIRLPFYYYIFDLPKSYASSSSYSKLVLLRFIKDLPIFISSAISIVLFIKIVLAYINGNIISKENKRRYIIIFVLLFISSLIFNILGLFEVKLLQSEFLYPYCDATYTIALRSLTEPLLYGFFIYLFKYYIESVHVKKSNKK